MAAKVKDMTTGSPWKLILLFVLPLMAGNVCQQLYTMVDTMVVGQIVGVEALAALGAVEWIMWLVLGISSGMAQGFGILVAQLYGAKNKEELKRAVAHSYMLMAVIVVFVLIISQVCAHVLLVLLDTPDNVIDMSLSYLRIVFWGIPVIAVYNIFAAILRALGNSRTPLTAMVIAAGMNVGLDILFVAKFRWGVQGAAAATVTAQAFSAIYCFITVHKIDLLSLTGEDFERNKSLDLKLLHLGAPIIFQDLTISLGGLVVQYVVNGYGFLFVAGFTATNKLYGVLEMAAISYGYAIVTYVGQNLGAGKIDRIRKGVRASGVIAFLTSVVIALGMLFFGKNLLSLFISGTPKQTSQVLAIAFRYLSIMAICLCILYFLYVYRSALQGLGNTTIPMISGIVEFFMRVGVVMILPKFIGENGIFYAEVVAWTGAAVLLAFFYYKDIRKIIL